jgi:hypothetical protein
LVGGFVGTEADKTGDALVEHQTTTRVGYHSFVAHVRPLSGVCEVGRPRTDLSTARRSVAAVERPA